MATQQPLQIPACWDPRRAVAVLSALLNAPGQWLQALEAIRSFLTPPPQFSNANKAAICKAALFVVEEIRASCMQTNGSIPDDLKTAMDWIEEKSLCRIREAIEKSERSLGDNEPEIGG